MRYPEISVEELCIQLRDNDLLGIWKCKYHNSENLFDFLYKIRLELFVLIFGLIVLAIIMHLIHKRRSSKQIRKVLYYDV